MKKRIKIAVLVGGWSQERDVSIKSGETVCEALDSLRYDVMTYDAKNDFQILIKERDKIDIVFSLLHGKFGEDGCVQGFLEILGIPYVGSGVLSSALALNKKVSKRMYMDSGMKVPKGMVIVKDQAYSVTECMKKIGSKVIVKPVSEGSSIGMSLCSKETELKEGIEEAFRYDDEVMIEEYVEGREVSCCVLGNRELRTLPLIEIIPKGGSRFFDYHAKYTDGATEEICPAILGDSLTEKAEKCAKNAHEALRCRSWSRTDMIIRGEDVFVLETNTIPGMTENSLFPLAARASGMTISELVDELINLSVGKTK